MPGPATKRSQIHSYGEAMHTDMGVSPYNHPKPVTTWALLSPCTKAFPSLIVYLIALSRKVYFECIYLPWFPFQLLTCWYLGLPDLRITGLFHAASHLSCRQASVHSYSKSADQRCTHRARSCLLMSACKSKTETVKTSFRRLCPL